MKKLLTLLLTAILVMSCTTLSYAEEAHASAANDWKSCISESDEADVDYLFRHKYEDPQIRYATTYLNMRKYPNIQCGEVEKVLRPNAEVKVVADYCGWSKVEVDSDGKLQYYYIWNEFLSKERVVIKEVVKPAVVEREIEFVQASNTNGNEYLGNFKLTAYCNCSSCCGKWAGGATASGTTPTAGRTVAMGGIPFGTKLSINGNVYTVEDRGTPYGHIDIYFNSHSEALQFGVKYADVYKIQ